MLAWLAGWLAGWLVCWLAGGWLAGWLAGWQAGWLVGWLAGWLAGRQVAAPILEKSSKRVLVTDGLEAEVSCSVKKGNPLPTFTWEYQNIDCPDADSCLPDENQWKSVPGNLMITPTNTPTSQSVVEVEKDQLAAFYRCKAVNTVGNDSHVIKLVRLGKKSFYLDGNTCTYHLYIRCKKD
ncbi:hypothetical protein ACROYT_G018573 [Oculina patagonica]